METKIATLCLVRDDKKILLGMKKRGFGVGRWNGFGGKVNSGEDIRAAAKRELQEESGLIAEEMEAVGKISFFYEYQSYCTVVSLFDVKKYSGEVTESEEMKPQWFNLDKIPYQEMWPDDQVWLPEFLKGEKFEAQFHYDKNNQITQQELKRKDIYAR